MFQLTKENETYWYPVQVELTAKEGGRKQKFDFEAEFNRLPQDEINELFRSRGEDEEKLRDADVIERVLVGWRKIKDHNGEDLIVNDENRATLLKQFPVPASIVKAFLKSIGIEGKAKN